MEAILMSLVKSAGSTLAKQIAEGLAGGMNLEFMKSKEGKLMQELQVLKTKIDEMGKSTIEAIRKQKIANAADRVRNCFARLEDAAKVQDVEQFDKWVKLIDGQDGVQDRLDDMNAVLTKDEGTGSPALLPPLAQQQWDKLQDDKNLDYGIREYEREQEATLSYPIMIERLGLCLVLLYYRTREKTDAVKEMSMSQAVNNSDKRVKAWRDLWNDRKKTCPAYDMLWKEIERQTAPEPEYKAPFIRTIQAAYNVPGMSGCRVGEVLDAVWVQANWQVCWREPSYAIHRHEFEFSFKPDTGRWKIYCAGCYFDAKLIPQSSPPNNQPYIRVRSKPGIGEHSVIQRIVTLVTLPLTVPPSEQYSKLKSWNDFSARTFLARVENHSSYTLIPRWRDPTMGWANADLYGAISSFECPVLPGGTSYLAGHGFRPLTGGTGLFEFAIWSSPSAITDSSQESEKKFHELKCFNKRPGYYEECVEYQPHVGAEFLGSLVLMVSVSYGGDPKGAMYASDYWPSEIVSLGEETWFTGDYKETAGGKRKLKVVDVEWEIQQGDHVGQPGTWFKVLEK